MWSLNIGFTVFTCAYVYRHPTASVRPNFQEVSQKLSFPDTKLLKWSEDKSTHPDAAKLGADLLCGEGLYKDLQDKYKLSKASDRD